MRVMSTRGADAATLTEAIAAGLARDGGLFLPPRPLPRPTGRPVSRSVADVARWVLAPFCADEPLGRELDAICAESFDCDAPTRWLADDLGLLELFHGPTAAFKDFGARFLAACLARIAGPATRTVLVATSGDTGAAVAAAFHGRAGFRVVVLYPDGLVSPRQAQQLGSFGGNVATYRVAGSFDDCQRLVKSAFADAGLRARAGLTSANSISLGRLLPQIAYWAKAALDAEAQGRAPVTFVVPTGNLGNAFACLMAREMGLPIARVVLATNCNHTLTELLATGRYEPRASIATLANAMDVGAPSNAERLLAWWPDVRATSAFLSAHSTHDEDIEVAIRNAHAEHGVVICPHTACGYDAALAARGRRERGPLVIAATAHPAKFESIVQRCIGRAVEPPPALEVMLARPSSSLPLASDAGSLARAIAAGLPGGADRA
ncbi:MAG: threonine synthase [Planctomycetes bacterium]|nr:threonine synthase [Planctomycetota bacterium]